MHQAITRVPFVCLLACAALAGLVGCNPAPRSADAVQDPADLWSIRGPATLPRGDVKLRTITVEVVTKSYQSGNERQAAFVIPHPVILAAGAAGVGLKTFEMTDREASDVASAAAYGVLDALGAAGWNAIEPSDADPLVTGFEPAGPLEREDRINLAATDTGRIREVIVVSPVAPTVWSGEASTDTTGLVEAGLVPALAVRLRVGIYQGYPSVEQGSRGLIVTQDGRTRTVSMDGSLIGTQLVATPASGGAFDVDADAMRAAIRELAAEATRGLISRAGG